MVRWVFAAVAAAFVAAVLWLMTASPGHVAEVGGETTVYKISGDKVYVREGGGWVPVLARDGYCRVEDYIKSLLDYLESPGVSPCREVEETASHLRHLLRAEWYCLYALPIREVKFVDGPLRDVVLTKDATWIGIYGAEIYYYDEEKLSEYVVSARDKCRRT